MSFSSIPPTSQSAPIDEFVILWTADKHKKLKKWHDGYLRYHTFNRRLMVYDHLNNKVCDKFLPEDEPMDVGDELVFESHLITIEDVKGRQSQDLRPLFEKTVDRRRARSTTATPMRAGTEAPNGQSPTPTLLRTIQSRPSARKSQPIYPTPTWQTPQRESPPPPAVVPQKRTAQGTPVVQKIVYKPFNVPKLKDGEAAPGIQTNITPSRPPNRPVSKRDHSVARHEPQSADHEQQDNGLGLVANLFEDDDDLEMLELDLDGSDFAAKPKPETSKPPYRVRPNAPPPFKPPLPQKNLPKSKQKNRADLPSIGHPSPEHEVKATASASAPPRQPPPSPSYQSPPSRAHKPSSPPLHQPTPSPPFNAFKIPPRPFVTPQRSQLIGSPPADVLPLETPTRLRDTSPLFLPIPSSSAPIDDTPSLAPIQSSIPIPSPSPEISLTPTNNSLQSPSKAKKTAGYKQNQDKTSQPEEDDVQDTSDKAKLPTGRLTLPSAASRTRRKLLCGLSAQNAAANSTPIARPVSTLSILHTFPKDDLLVAAPAPRPKKLSRKDTPKEARAPVEAPRQPLIDHSHRTNVATKLEEDEDGYAQRPDMENKPQRTPNPRKSSVNSRVSKIDKTIKLEPIDDDGIPIGANSDDDQLVCEAAESDQLKTEGLAANEPEEREGSKLQIFSSDEEPEISKLAAVPKPKTKKIRKKPHPSPLPDTSDSDDFDALRLSGLPKQLVSESRNIRPRKKAHTLSEASRVWREVEEGTVPRS
ncbi:hypothetical protein Dda_7254 [Drechslerella dactyloides]|uniref:5'-3' DNA helicase ZGRF1-like N-terminal domain-containing protein n=1 Tax=Drechslerella dactyloides TaxID=74499 RepID=A0AAD6NGK4_DREDA|nr:hypothetical protein Dda_7254 [Drechslerella dactyloides]